jgi:hypothetical protein
MSFLERRMNFFAVTKGFNMVQYAQYSNLLSFLIFIAKIDQRLVNSERRSVRAGRGGPFYNSPTFFFYSFLRTGIRVSLSFFCYRYFKIS